VDLQRERIETTEEVNL